MFRAFHSARKKSLTSSFVLALALTAGTAVGVAGFAQPAFAQKKPKAAYSAGFVAAYTPVEQAQKAIGETGDHTPLKAQIPAMVAAIESADDRFAAGQFVLAVGNKTNDPALQRQGLELTLASGKVDPAQVGKLQFFVGSLAFQAKDYAAARTALEAAKTAGYADDDVHSLLIEAYLQGGATTEGLDYLTKLARERAAAGTPVSEKWLRRGLAVAYRDKLAARSNELAAMLVANSPTAENWQASLQVVREINQWSNEEVLDLSRLMQLSGGLKSDYDLAEYVEAADPRKLSNEVIAALDAATKAGLIPANAPRFAELRTIAQERAAADRAEAAKAPGQTQASGVAALATGDLLLSVGSYADAEAMYQQALDKGGVDANRALTRKGIAQLRQGKTAEAKATFAQVQGTRASLAHLWTIYADRGTVAAAAAAPAPAG